jgi:3-keto steroid reductase
VIDEFLYTRPESHHLKLIITTRSAAKGADTIKRLRKHLGEWDNKSIRTVSGLFKQPTAAEAPPVNRRISFQSEILELTSLISVRDCSRKLLKSEIRLDAVILNAGVGWVISMNWPLAIWTTCTDMIQALTWPQYKHQAKGVLTQRQLPKSQNEKQSVEPEPPLGEFFTANVFGHYMLAHNLSPLLSRSSASEEPGRIVWVSSISAYAHSFSLDDLQGIRTDYPYECSKRLTDVLALTSELPSTRAYTNTFLTPPSSTTSKSISQQPRTYLTHPGVFFSSIIVLPWILSLFHYWSYFIARFIGSPWHTIHAYPAAASATWIAISPQRTLDAIEGQKGKGKWGSSTDWYGRERVVKTETEGWGLGGRVGPESRAKGMTRWVGMTDLTPEAREGFEALGADTWRAIEELRVEWEARIGSV